MDSDWWAKVRKARDGQMSDEPKPLTDEELDALDGLRECRAYHTLCGPEDPGEGPEPDSGALRHDHVRLGTEIVPRLVAEVRRLRSDEWLRAAASDIGEGVTRDGWNGESLPESEGGVEGDILAMLLRRRDRKA